MKVKTARKAGGPRRAARASAFVGAALLGAGCLSQSINPDEAADPRGGHEPVMGAVVQALKAHPTQTCIPPLPVVGSGEVNCALFADLHRPSACNGSTALSPVTLPDPYFQELLATQGTGSQFQQDAQNGSICVVHQDPHPSGASCANDSPGGWCYVVDGGGVCPQQIVLSSDLDSTLTNATILYACLPLAPSATQ